MRYQAVFSKYGEHIHVPLEATSKEEAISQAMHDNPQIASWPLSVKPLKDGEQARDDRTELKWAPPQMGRPSQGRSVRLQAAITPEQMTWLEEQKALDGDKSISDVVFRLINEMRKK